MIVLAGAVITGVCAIVAAVFANRGRIASNRAEEQAIQTELSNRSDHGAVVDHLLTLSSHVLELIDGQAVITGELGEVRVDAAELRAAVEKLQSEAETATADRAAIAEAAHTDATDATADRAAIAETQRGPE